MECEKCGKTFFKFSINESRPILCDGCRGLDNKLLEIAEDLNMHVETIEKIFSKLVAAGLAKRL